MYLQKFSVLFFFYVLKHIFAKMALRGELKCLKDFAIFALAN